MNHECPLNDPCASCLLEVEQALENYYLEKEL